MDVATDEQIKRELVARITSYLADEIELKHLKLYLLTEFRDYHGEACQWLWRAATGHAAMYNLGGWSEGTYKDALRWMLRYDAGDPNPGDDPMFGLEWSRIMFRPQGPPWPFQVMEDRNDARWQFLYDKPESE